MAATQRKTTAEPTVQDVENEVLHGLNGEQRAAAEATDRPTLVVSPAGTGKTRLLAARYNLMLARGVSANRLLAITFTNRATQEMRDRIGPVLDGVDERDIFINTFHTLGKRILSQTHKIFGLTDRFRIADEGESHQVLREAVRRIDPDSLGTALGDDRVKRLAELLDKIKNEAMTPGMVADRGYLFNSRTVDRTDIEILEEYESQMARDDIVDYNDLILKPLLAFNHDPELAKRWNRQFVAVMIDEYQDTNKTQYQLLRHLTSNKDNVLFLGDDDQLIFAWRGASNSYVLDFEQHWPKGQVLTLRINYRNAPEILKRAKTMIDKNVDRRTKDMIANRSDEAILELRVFDDESEERDYIARLVQSQIDKGLPLDQIAILTRQRLEANNIAISLAAHGIPCFYPDNDIMTNRQVRALISWARVAINPNDRLALMNAMATPDVGLTAAAIDKLNDWSRDRKEPLIKVAQDSLDNGSARADGPLARFIENYKALRKVDLSAPRAFEGIVHAVGLDKTAEASSPAAAESLNQAIAIFNSSLEDLRTVPAVLDAISISAKSALEARQGQARVRVDTMHASKGLEFAVVIVSGWEEKNFPRNEREVEEDRRLAYVTVSRARDMFVATICRKRPNASGRVASRFLTEIGVNDGDIL